MTLLFKGLILFNYFFSFLFLFVHGSLSKQLYKTICSKKTVIKERRWSPVKTVHYIVTLGGNNSLASMYFLIVLNITRGENNEVEVFTTSTGLNAIQSVTFWLWL